MSLCNTPECKRPNELQENQTLSFVSSHQMHCVKSMRIRSFFGPYFPAFGLNTDQKNFEYGHFSRSDIWMCHSRRTKNNMNRNIREPLEMFMMTTFCYDLLRQAKHLNLYICLLN